MEYNLQSAAELTIEQRKIFYELQKRATEWLNTTFTRYVCNWQDFSRKRAFENFTCVKRVKKDTQITIVIIYYKIGDSIEDSEFFTYKHDTNFYSFPK